MGEYIGCVAGSTLCFTRIDVRGLVGILGDLSPRGLRANSDSIKTLKPWNRWGLTTQLPKWSKKDTR